MMKAESTFKQYSSPYILTIRGKKWGKEKKENFKNSGNEMNFHFNAQAINLQTAISHIKENKSTRG